MTNIRITKQFSFETGHALYGYDGKCKNVHGHSYRLDVTVIGQPITDSNNVKFGMVIDFSDLKKIVKEEIVNVFDHATVFNKNTPHVELANELQKRGHNVLLVDYQPTSEMMVIDFAEKIKNHLNYLKKTKKINLVLLKNREFVYKLTHFNYSNQEILEKFLKVLLKSFNKYIENEYIIKLTSKTDHDIVKCNRDIYHYERYLLNIYKSFHNIK